MTLERGRKEKLFQAEETLQMPEGWENEGNSIYLNYVYFWKDVGRSYSLKNLISLVKGFIVYPEYLGDLLKGVA
jgi:hypothetical protein